MSVSIATASNNDEGGRGLFPFDTVETDRLLSTTRAVRKRLDLERMVDKETVLECVRLSQQAPTASNSQTWSWIFVTDAGRRRQLASLYQRAFTPYAATVARAVDPQDQNARIMGSAGHLAEVLHTVPVLAVPCVQWPGALETLEDWAGMFGSILPAVWNFQLALRSRGLGSCFTTMHLRYADEAAALLNLPEGVTQVALLPIAYTLGTDFRVADRPPPEAITHWNDWDPTVQAG